MWERSKQTVNCGGRRGREQGTRISQRRGTLVQIADLRLWVQNLHVTVTNICLFWLPNPRDPPLPYYQSSLGPLPWSCMFWASSVLSWGWMGNMCTMNHTLYCLNRRKRKKVGWAVPPCLASQGMVDVATSGVAGTGACCCKPAKQQGSGEPGAPTVWHITDLSISLSWSSGCQDAVRAVIKFLHTPSTFLSFFFFNS